MPVSRNMPGHHAASNPFHTIFDGEEESDGDWWDDEEDERLPSELPKSTSAMSISQWPRPPGEASITKHAKVSSHTGSRRIEKRYSVQKPRRESSKGRQKKQNALAGIKVVTNFSKHGGSISGARQKAQKPQPQMGRFVDLAALQALAGGSPEATGASATLASFWKSRRNKTVKPTPKGRSSCSEKDGPSEEGLILPIEYRNLAPPPLGLDLSPSDRPIVIGLSILSAKLPEHSISPQTAASDTPRVAQSYGDYSLPTNRTPETPTIIITPVQASTIWSALGNDSEGLGKRPFSSTNSDELHNAIGILTKNETSPVPQMPTSILRNERQLAAAERSYFSPDSDEGATWDEVNQSVTSRSRAFSTGTVFEEDESPVIDCTGRGRAVSMSSGFKVDKHTSFSTVDTRHRSKGWWNYILNTPFLSRSNTVTQRGVFEDQNPPPAMPDIGLVAAKAQEAEREREGKLWEKQFSPVTPNTTTTNFSDTWWDITAKGDTFQHLHSLDQAAVIRHTRPKSRPSTETIPFVLSEIAGSRVPTMSAVPNVDSNSQLDHTEVVNSHVGSTQEIFLSVHQLSTRDLGTTGGSNPFVQSRLYGSNNAPGSTPHMPAVDLQAAQPLQPGPGRAPLQTPPPPYSPPPSMNPQYRAILPTTVTQNPPQSQSLHYPISPGLLSPSLQQEMNLRGGIPMSDVPLTPATIPRRPIGSQYPELPLRQTPMVFAPPPLQPLSKKAQKAEAKRRRHEKEDAVARKAGGWWRGRGCVPNSGCYGRSGTEGRKKRRCYFGLVVSFLTMIILAVVLATTLHRKSNTYTGPSQWVNLTGFPPIFTGISTVADPVNIETNAGCVSPSSQWSCDLPKELHDSIGPNPSNRPNFLLQIQWDNSSATNATFSNVTGNPRLRSRTLAAGNPVAVGQFMKNLFLKSREIVTFAPNPAPPSYAEGFFLGNTTDEIVSSQKAGEPTPFYISLLPPSSNTFVTRRGLVKRTISPFPNITELIPAPSINKNGTAAPANLLPLPFQQPIRLYDRGLLTEHYGFYSYFDRSIFLKSITASSQPITADKNGGASKSEAEFRCTWAETRFLIQMWTRRNSTARLLNSTSELAPALPANLTQPGTFPYPISITLDRHGGDPKRKMLYCYEIDDNEGVIPNSGVLVSEARGFGGTLINPAAQIFNNSSDPLAGGIDGGTGGCSCQWSNFLDVN